ncbi:hypothetical protein B0H15DRAFT_298681 [Mycena belliarum]|uniref:Uncharacterized protein n=1 Tax=Mycena belliarum TaxID=1033014 RepID=A0AAD6XLR7_9AGAR|nr:hypothetical protein B0H15DRAFT_298681 [Mycena belliae]
MHRPPSILRDCRWRCRHRGKLLWFQATEAPLGAIFGDTPGRVARHLALAAGSEYISNFGICESAEIEWPRARASKRARTSTSAARSDGVPPTASGQPKSNSRLVHKAAVERAILLHDLDTLNNKRAAFKWWRSHSEQELSKISDEISSGKRIIGSRRLLSWRRTAILELLRSARICSCLAISMASSSRRARRARTVDIFASSESRLLTLPAESKHSEDKARGCVKRDMDESVLRKSRLLLIWHVIAALPSVGRRATTPTAVARAPCRLPIPEHAARRSPPRPSSVLLPTTLSPSPSLAAPSMLATPSTLAAPRSAPPSAKPHLPQAQRPPSAPRASSAASHTTPEVALVSVGDGDRTPFELRAHPRTVRAPRHAGMCLPCERVVRLGGGTCGPWGARSRRLRAPTPAANSRWARLLPPSSRPSPPLAARRHLALRAVRIPARIASWDPDRPWMHARPAPCAPSVHDSLTARAADGYDSAHEP